ncbi:ACP S-malonyltransferase [Paenibacillus sp. YPG26]|uniref:ACP S-malonyltransferase n=1 Tax=Paenibacillus sp. YPG26 TaxID=2878915 RepID=UPI0020414F00|nr:ACP S-malonyltransferase [Paenibacillus sp. YPG26]USB33501.1 ACP S-malonyltransferase [Paenibacillus sp. YPG26]
MNGFAMMFPGQGSQYVGMAKGVSARSRAARLTFEEAGDALGWDVQHLCNEGDLTRLTQTDNAQPAILTCSVAAYRAWIELGGPEPLVGAGHSLGEFSALACSGALGFADAVKLVRERGGLMQEASRTSPGGMAAIGGIGISDEQLEEALARASEPQSIVVIAGINSQEQRVVSGHPDALLRLKQILAKLDPSARFIPLQVSAAFHSPLMGEAAERFRERLESCRFHTPKWPVLSNVTGQPHESVHESYIRLLASQLTEPVRWAACMDAIRSFGVRQAAELGPGRVLTGLLRSYAPDLTVWSSDDEPGRLPLASALPSQEHLPGAKPQGNTGAAASKSGSGVQDHAVTRPEAEGTEPVLSAQRREDSGATGPALSGQRREDSGATGPALSGQRREDGRATGPAISAQRREGSPASGPALFLPRCLGIAVATPNGCAELEAYRLGVLEPYRKVEALVQELRRTGLKPTEEQLHLGWEMLLSQFDTKGTNFEERRLRLSRLLEETGTSHLFEVPQLLVEGGVAQ